jgi:cytoskeletal protein CcmA (bactofilin family)
MWKNSQAGTFSITTAVEPTHTDPALPALRPNVRTAAPASGQSCIGKDLMITGEISGADSLESLFIEGRVEGAINLPFSRVTVGVNGQVKAGIAARDIVVMGTILGNITASNRVEIRAAASVTGEVSAPRVNIEEGAFFKGKLDVTAAGAEPVAAVEAPAKAELKPPTMIFVQPEVRKLRVRPSLQTA